jgi:tRNA(fMet)-specific endonuclease VapC
LVEALLQAVPVFPFGLPWARRRAELGAALAARSKLIGPYDMLLGATALALGYSLATLNRDEFRRVPGLQLLATERFMR